MEGKSVLVSASWRCPFCGRLASASSEQLAIYHEMPMCPKFEQLDPIEYMQAVNAELAKKASN